MKIILILVSSIFCFSIKCQTVENMVKNGSFEEGQNGPSISQSNDLVTYENWKGLNCGRYNKNEGFEYFDTTKYCGKPNFQRVNCNNFHGSYSWGMFNLPGGGGTPLGVMSNNGFMYTTGGENKCSLLFTELESPVVKDKWYYFELYYLLVNGSASYPNLKVSLRKDGYNDNQKINLVSKEIKQNDFAQCNWKKLSFHFKSTKNYDLNYLRIEISNEPAPGFQCDFYSILIDDIKLFPACELEFNCSYTKGEINEEINQAVTDVSNLVVSNILNVHTLKAKITQNGQNVLPTFEVINPMGNTQDVFISMDGLSSGTYNADFEIKNDCTEKIFSKTIIKATNQEPQIPLQPTYCQDCIPIPIPNCIPNYVLYGINIDDNKYLTFPKDDPVSIVIKDNLHVNDVVFTNNTNVIMQAGKSIIFESGTTIGNGARLIAQIDQSLKSERLDSDNFYKNILGEKIYTLHPNPHREQFTLSQTEEGYIKSYRIMDVMGRVMLSATFGIGKETSINTSNLAKGIYILHLETTQGLKAERIVKE